jgi:hypothetical protein
MALALTASPVTELATILFCGTTDHRRRFVAKPHARSASKQTSKAAASSTNT